MEGNGHSRVRTNWKAFKGIKPTLSFVGIGAKLLEDGSAVAKDEEETQGFSLHIPHLALAMIDSLHSQLASWAPAVSSSALFLPPSQEVIGFLRLRPEEGQ